jgi:hypothetical protein
MFHEPVPEDELIPISNQKIRFKLNALHCDIIRGSPFQEPYLISVSAQVFHFLNHGESVFQAKTFAEMLRHISTLTLPKVAFDINLTERNVKNILTLIEQWIPAINKTFYIIKR